MKRLRDQRRAARRRRSAKPDKALARYAGDPCGFFRDVLGFDPWDAQIEIAEAVRDHDLVAVRSGHKIGKSSIAAGLVLWWACTRDNARAVATAPTGRQVRSVLWREVRALYRRAKRRGYTLGEIFKVPERGFVREGGDYESEVFGFSTDDPDQFSGISGAHILYVVDEASGVEEAIFEAIHGNRAGGAKVLLLGNPTRPVGSFAQAFKSPDWIRIHVSSARAANHNDARQRRGLPPIKGLATTRWISERARVWGVDSAVYQIRVEGEFATQGTDAVIPVGFVAAAQRRASEVVADGVLQVGVDVARFGDDDSVIAPRRGRRILPLTAIHGQRTNEIAGAAIAAAKSLRTADEAGRGVKVRIAVDVIGVGGGVADTIRESISTSRGTLAFLELIEVDVAEAADDNEEFYQLRDELWFSLRTWLEEGGALPADDIALETELVAPTYKFDSRGRRKVSSKDDLRELLDRSPDRADAVVLAVAPVRRRGVAKSARVRGL